MRRRVGAGLLVVGLGLTGLALAPGSASGADGGPVGAVRQALAGLVAEGTIDQGQADRVAEVLQDQEQRAPRPAPADRPHGGRLDRPAMAEAVGISVKELRSGLQAGRTLAQLAEERGVVKADLVDRLVAAGQAQLAEDVTAGALTQAQADVRHEQLLERVIRRVDQVNKPGPAGEERKPRD